MRIREISLHHFRNYTEAHFSFDERITVIQGKNAVGKTNLLEAVAYLSLPRSFRGVRDRDLIRWGAAFFRLEGLIESSQTPHTITVRYRTGQKEIFLDGKTVHAFSELFEHFVVVTTTGRDQALLDGPPETRRRKIDWLLSVIDPIYFRHLIGYRKALVEKNRMLREGAEPEVIRAWNRKMEELGRYLVEKRSAVIPKLSERLRPRAQRFLRTEEIALVYQPSSSLEPGSLDRLLEREQALGFSLAGPHRDRIEFLVRGRSPIVSASEGEKRYLLLAFITAVSELIAEARGEYPVLALDEPKSILGWGFEDLVAGYPGQILMTSLTPLEGIAAHTIILS